MGSVTQDMRRDLVNYLAPYRENALADHPWAGWASDANNDSHRMPGAASRWSAGKDTSWVPLRIARVGEVKYDHLQGDRFRHTARFQRWRPDREASSCTYEQLEAPVPMELLEIFEI